MLPADPLACLLDLSHQLGSEDRKLAILGKGNTSVRLSEQTFAVKASGSNLGSLTKAGIAECVFEKLTPLMSADGVTDVAIDEVLFAARVSAEAKKPSVEAIFHAYLLTLRGVNYVGHTHPVAVNVLLCSKHTRTFAARRIFPDEIVCCGVESVFVPDADPGLKLSQAIGL